MLVCRKIFSAFYSILHEIVSKSCGFHLISEFNVFSPHLVLYNMKHFCSTLTSFSNLAGDHFCFIKSSLCYVLIWKMFLQNNFQKWSLSQMFFKIGVIINFPIFTRKYLRWSLFLIKLQYWCPATLLKKRYQHSCFPWNTSKCLRKAFFVKHLGWLLLKLVEKFP